LIDDKADAEQLRKRLTEAEMSHARTKHDVGTELKCYKSSDDIVLVKQRDQ
jgi:hypothetical protein